MDTNELMTRNEVCAYAGIDWKSLSQLMTKGIVTPAVRSGNGGKRLAKSYNQNQFTREQADRIKRYVEAIRELKAARKALR